MHKKLVIPAGMELCMTSFFPQVSHLSLKNFPSVPHPRQMMTITMTWKSERKSTNEISGFVSIAGTE